MMITCATAINSGIQFHPHRLPCWSLSSPASRKHFPSTSTPYPIQKDVGHYYFRASEFPGRVSVRAVATKVETDHKIDVLTQIFNKTDALAPTLDDVVPSFPEAPSVQKTSKKERKKERNPIRLSSRASQAKRPDDFPVIRYPLGTESAIKAMLECNTLVFVVDKRADKKNIREDVKKIFNVRAKKVNTSIMPDGKKKAYIILAPEFKASDVAKKIKIL